MRARCCRCSVKEVDDADDMFTKLMGDVVEPRREFIQEQRADRQRGRVGVAPSCLMHPISPEREVF